MIDKEIQAALIGLFGAFLGAVGGWLAARSTNKFQKTLAEDTARAQKRAAIDGMILKMIEFSMQYPTLEKREFCHAYPKTPGDANGRERYENYCCFVFNTLVAIWSFCDKDAKKVAEIIHLEEILHNHHPWWKEDRENYGYHPEFRQFINTAIDLMREKEKIK